MQKWEYLRVSDYEVFTFYDTATGFRQERVKRGVEYGKRLAALGEEGWELVCCVGDLLYFKRPKP